jgi:hypothetical protein|nr:MAG TPA: protein of unknown function (DUF4376) [Caudoviricetes sp.]
MIYVKLNTDNTIEYAKNVYTTDEGELILNFKANPELMKKYGFKELIDSPVEFDANYQTYTVSYIEDADSITKQYSITYLPIETLKEVKLKELADYDTSDNVNDFDVNGLNAWFDKDTRAALSTSIESALLLGESTITFVINDNEFSIDITTAKQMLAAVQRYADKCFLVTEAHKRAIKGLTEAEAIVNYDFKTGYPTKVTFTL